MLTARVRKTRTRAPGISASGNVSGTDSLSVLTRVYGSVATPAVFVNYNAGTYDLVPAEGVLQRDARHEDLEMGFGLTIR